MKIILQRWLWLCPVVGLIGAVTVFRQFGFSLLAALGIAFLFSCPAVVIWTLREAHRAFAPSDRLAQQPCPRAATAAIESPHGERHE